MNNNIDGTTAKEAGQARTGAAPWGQGRGKEDEETGDMGEASRTTVPTTWDNQADRGRDNRGGGTAGLQALAEALGRLSRIEKANVELEGALAGTDGDDMTACYMREAEPLLRAGHAGATVTLLSVLMSCHPEEGEKRLGAAAKAVLGEGWDTFRQAEARAGAGRGSASETCGGKEDGMSRHGRADLGVAGPPAHAVFMLDEKLNGNLGRPIGEEIDLKQAGQEALAMSEAVDGHGIAAEDVIGRASMRYPMFVETLEHRQRETGAAIYEGGTVFGFERASAAGSRSALAVMRKIVGQGMCRECSSCPYIRRCLDDREEGICEKERTVVTWPSRAEMVML